MRLIPLCVLVIATGFLASCSSTQPNKHRSPKVASNSGAAAKTGTRISSVRTTAYTHTEADHTQYGAANAAGGRLKYGSVKSAAADWSVYPVGTVFQIDGDSSLYEVDDYGSALVGTNTIDLYKPDKSAMNNWGVRNVNIRVIKWGSFTKSLAIMKPRSKYDHIRKMVGRIQKSS